VGELQPSGNVRRNMTKRPLPILLVCAAIGIACRSEKLFEPPVPTKLEVTPDGVTLLQGGSGTVAVTLTRGDGFTLPVILTVTDVPTGVSAIVSDVQNTDRVITATVTLNVSGSTMPGSHSLVVRGAAIGVAAPATAAFTLTVTPSASCPGSGVCEQWAESASASSEYTATDWSANQATGVVDANCYCGAPISEGCPEGYPRGAWASLEPDGVEWLELGYQKSVRPTEIHIYEVFAVSSIVKVEVKDGAGIYHTVYTAQPGYQPCPRVLTVPVTGISAMVKVVRLSFDQRANNNWDEIDAVKLIGDR
jgi:hypothetical protein